jgi:hypothetical protein
MAAVVECGCGERLEAEDEAALLAEVDAHVAMVHPELLGTLSPLELAQPPSLGRRLIAGM